MPCIYQELTVEYLQGKSCLGHNLYQAYNNEIFRLSILTQWQSSFGLMIHLERIYQYLYQFETEPFQVLGDSNSNGNKASNLRPVYFK